MSAATPTTETPAKPKAERKVYTYDELMAIAAERKIDTSAIDPIRKVSEKAAFAALKALLSKRGGLGSALAASKGKIVAWFDENLPAKDYDGKSFHVRALVGEGGKIEWKVSLRKTFRKEDGETVEQEVESDTEAAPE